jgi:hypothetical protein
VNADDWIAELMPLANPLAVIRSYYELRAVSEAPEEVLRSKNDLRSATLSFRASQVHHVGQS